MNKLLQSLCFFLHTAKWVMSNKLVSQLVRRLLHVISLSCWKSSIERQLAKFYYSPVNGGMLEQMVLESLGIPNLSPNWITYNNRSIISFPFLWSFTIQLFDWLCCKHYDWMFWYFVKLLISFSLQVLDFLWHTGINSSKI